MIIRKRAGVYTPDLSSVSMLLGPVCPHVPSAAVCLLQDWLTESARLISKCGYTVEWVTPLGLPVVQPYHRTRFQVVSLKRPHLRMWQL